MASAGDFRCLEIVYILRSSIILIQYDLSGLKGDETLPKIMHFDIFTRFNNFDLNFIYDIENDFGNR